MVIPGHRSALRQSKPWTDGSRIVILLGGLLAEGTGRSSRKRGERGEKKKKREKAALLWKKTRWVHTYRSLSVASMSSLEEKADSYCLEALQCRHATRPASVAAA